MHKGRLCLITRDQHLERMVNLEPGWRATVLRMAQHMSCQVRCRGHYRAPKGYVIHISTIRLFCTMDLVCRSVYRWQRFPTKLAM